MSIYNFINRKINLPISDLLLNRKIDYFLKFMEKSQYWSLNNLENFQNEKLKDLIIHSFNNVQYYNELFKELKLTPNDIRTKSDLIKLPILKKETIKKNINKFKAHNISPKNYIHAHSSGSTGEPLHYTLSKDAYSLNKACYLRGYSWMGYELGDKGIKISHGKRKLFNKKLQDRINRFLLFPYSYSKDNIENLIILIRKNRPEFIRSYPDPLLFIANYCIKKDITFNGVRAINTTGNTLFNETREAVEKVFNTKIFDSYNCEGGALVFECPTHNGYHSSMEYGITEIVDPEGKEVKANEQGRLITTDLWNYATPFIRYDSQDLVVRGDNYCSCGRGLITIKRILGRDNDVLVTPSGQFLIAQVFTTFFKMQKSVDHFQIYQERLNKIIIKLEVNISYSKEIEKTIIKHWVGYMKNDVRIEIELIDKIELLNSNKRRFLIRNKDIEIGI